MLSNREGRGWDFRGRPISTGMGQGEMGEGLQVGGTRKCRIRKVTGTLYFKKKEVVEKSNAGEINKI